MDPVNGNPGTAMWFLAEWYRTGPAAMSVDDVAAHLARSAATDTTHASTAVVMAMTMPHDETFFCIFTAASAQAVAHTCQTAGWPADRISTDITIWPQSHQPPLSA